MPSIMSSPGNQLAAESHAPGFEFCQAPLRLSQGDLPRRDESRGLFDLGGEALLLAYQVLAAQLSLRNLQAQVAVPGIPASRLHGRGATRADAKVDVVEPAASDDGFGQTARLRLQLSRELLQLGHTLPFVLALAARLGRRLIELLQTAAQFLGTWQSAGLSSRYLLLGIEFASPRPCSVALLLEDRTVLPGSVLEEPRASPDTSRPRSRHARRCDPSGSRCTGCVIPRR